jgi:hypothetical protein
LSAGLVSNSFRVLRAPSGDGLLSTLELVLGRVAPPVVSDSDGDLWDRLAQSLLDHPGVAGLGVGQGDEELGGGGQGGECPADILLLPVTLYDQGQRSERQIELRRDVDLFPQCLLAASRVCSSFLILFLPTRSVQDRSPRR